MVDIVQTDKGDMELAGLNARGNGFLNTNATYHPSSNATTIMLVADRAYRIKGLNGRVEVAGTDAGAVTATIFKAPSGTALSAGTALHSGTFNLKGTAATNQSLTLSTTDATLNIAAGDTIGVILTGVLTTATGGITVALTPR